MQTLNLPTYSFKIKSEGDRKFIFDRFRKKYVVLTPEEWVRQHFAVYLVNEKSFPAGRIVVEKTLKFNKMERRCDLLVYGDSSPALIVECKAPEVKITQDVFDQIAVYNLEFRVEYLVVTNGIDHYCCMVDFKSGKIHFIDNIPEYSAIRV
jgi:hypothetical protein